MEDFSSIVFDYWTFTRVFLFFFLVLIELYIRWGSRYFASSSSSSSSSSFFFGGGAGFLYEFEILFLVELWILVFCCCARV